MRFLVTGGAGFIGSHIVERLLKEGHFVRVLDNFSSGKEENLSFTKGLSLENRDCPNASLSSVIGTVPIFELLKGDIRDLPTCLQATRDIDFILHQAALRSVPKSMTRPHEYNAVNIDGTVNILEAALKSKVKRVVMASSSSVYGNTTKFPQQETDTPLLISPYALTKLAGEHYSRVFSENYGLETVNLRYFNVFGPRQSLDDEYAVVIPKFIDCMLDDRNPPVHGTGKQSRDFTYIDNVVEANILAATVTPPSLRGREATPVIARRPKADEAISSTFCEVFNVACGRDNSILDLVDSLNKIMSKSIKPVFEPHRAGDVPRTLADISKIKSLLRYEPKIGFEDGLRRTVSWFANRLEAADKKI